MNRLTKTIDVDIYDENSNKVDVKLPSNVSIKITIGRMKEKDNTGLGILAMPTAVNINVTVGYSYHIYRNQNFRILNLGFKH